MRSLDSHRQTAMDETSDRGVTVSQLVLSSPHVSLPPMAMTASRRESCLGAVPRQPQH